MFKTPFSVSFAFLSMTGFVILSNYLVQFPINDWLTWGAFSYPITFLITELTNRSYGPQISRRVVYMGFAWAVVLSLWLATPRIALASGFAFLVSQLLDIGVFNKWRQRVWWQAPLYASLAASIVDTAIFWMVAFWGEPVPLFTWMVGDLSIKFLLDIMMLTPFRLLMTSLITARQLREM